MRRRVVFGFVCAGDWVNVLQIFQRRVEMPAKDVGGREGF
jgi:hypothetical protein